MSTYRERKEAKAENLREWADKREANAAAVFEHNSVYTDDIAFNTQPGHIPLRARVIRQNDRAMESMSKAGEMTRRAAGIESQLDQSIYSDDVDAVERLTERIAALEAEREVIKTENAAFRKTHRTELAALTAYGRDQAMPHPAYRLANLSGNIKRNRDRLVEVTARQERTAATEEAGGTLVEALTSGYVRVTFAEKPDRNVLDALRAAGFRWGRGSWTGQASQLPSDIEEQS